MTPAFKLQPLLNYRVLLENRARQELLETLSQEAELERTISAGRHALTAQQAEFEARRDDGIGLQELLLYENSLRRQAEQLKKLLGQAEKLRHTIEQRRQSLVEASKDRKLLEKLREKKAAEHRQELLRQEMVQLDELALRRDKEVL